MIRTNKIEALVKRLTAIARAAGSRSDSHPYRSPCHLISLFHDAKLECGDWLPYAMVDHAAPYTRNLIARLPNDSKLMLLVWSPQQQSPVHSHANTHCVMKILSGRLSETLYGWPRPMDAVARATLEPIRQRTLCAGQVGYMADEMGVHKIKNDDKGSYAASLHLYMSRPELQARPVELFDDRTGGLLDAAPMKFHSEGGMLLQD